MAGELATSAHAVGSEFSRLTSTANALLDELREFPAYGSLWETHFHRTFSHFMKLWRMQQENRQILERPEVYGLQRSEIGQIASKIGQLYYHLYLRTGDLRFLCESSVFYTAIQARGYFETTHPHVPSLRTLYARLRYLARYIVVTLLRGHFEQAKAQAALLSQLVDDYSRMAAKTGPSEWEMLVEELERFLRAENMVAIANSPSDFHFSRRLPPRGLSETMLRPHIGQAILVGNFSHQIKFSELTLDTFRICHLLEFDLAAGEKDAHSDTGLVTPKDSLPAKHILYRPTVAKVLSHLSQSHAALARPNSILFVYLSADGFQHPSTESGPFSPLSTAGSGDSSPRTSYTSSRRDATETPPLMSPGMLFPDSPAVSVPSSSSAASSSGDSPPNSPKERPAHRARRTSLLSQQAISSGTVGGLLMNSNSPTVASPSSSSLAVDFLYPHDFIPFLRKPLALVIDSDNSCAFRTIRPFFNQPVICLMSPEAQPSQLKDSTHSGNLFTFFLYDPLAALSFICGLSTIDYPVFTACQETLSEAAATVEQLYDSIEKVPQSVKFMVADPSLRLIIFRFLFCYTALSYHRLFVTSRSFLPSISPALPPNLLAHPSLRTALASIATALDIQSFFNFS